MIGYSADFLRQVLDSTADAIVIMDEAGIIRSANASTRTLFGRTREDLIGKPATILMPEAYRAAHVEWLQRPPTGESRILGRELEVEGLRADGSTFPIALRVTEMHHDGQKLFVGVMQDLTARRAAEAKARLHDERLRRLIHSPIIGMIVADYDGRIYEANDAFLRLAGYTRQDLEAGHVRWDLMTPPEYRSLDERAVQELKATGVATPWDKEYVRPDGTRVPVTAGVVRLDEATGLNIAYILDRSAQTVAERALRENEQFLQALLKNLPGLAYRCRNDAEWTVEFVSDGARELTGHPPEAYFGQNRVHVPDLIFEEDRARVWDETQAALARRQPYEVVYRIVPAKGPIKWVWDKGQAVYDSRGELEALVGFITDISALKRAEEELRQAQKMEAVGRLAGGIAHDFNNLMTAVIGYSDMLLRRLPENDPLRPELQDILKAGQRAAELTKQLLAFSRKQVMRPTVFDLGRTVLDTEKMLRRVIREDIELVVARPGGPLLVKADPLAIEQVVMNLSLNARDAMPRGGRLAIEMGEETLDADAATTVEGAAPGRYAYLAVADSGVGMDEATLAHVFEPFFTTKEPGKGTGLGLSSVYGIVRQSGGHIVVTSAPGRGSIFRVRLPSANDPAATVPVPREKPLATGTETILLVEDNEAVRALVKSILTAQGYRVIDAVSGAEAIERATQHKGVIDLLLTDVVMPRMNGRETFHALRRLRPSLSVLYMSGHAQRILDGDLIDREAKLLEKPFTPDTLAAAVREALRATSR